jgi:uncharacterized protein
MNKLITNNIIMETSTEKLKQYLKNLISGLVFKQEFINISVLQDELGILFTIKVDQSDVGKVIGKNGTIAESIRTIMRCVGQIEGLRVSVKIDCPKSNYGK